MARKVEITSSNKAVIEAVSALMKPQYGNQEYLITEQTVADKHGIEIEEVIALEKEAINLELDIERDPKRRRIIILNNLLKNKDYYKEVQGGIKANFTDAIITNDKGQILFLNRNKKDDIGANKLCFPGGHLEKFLSPERNVKKEIKEETGLDVIQCNLINRKKINNGKNQIFYFYCTIPKDSEVVLNEREHSNYIWMDLKDIINTPNDKFIFDLKNYLLYTILGMKKE